MMNKATPAFLFDLWFLMAGRIAPQLCCTVPPPMHQKFQAALHEVALQNGDLDRAVDFLHEIVTRVPPDWMVFQQAGQLLSIIEWRRTYHPSWFSQSVRGQRLHAGKCGPYIAQAMALLQSGADDEVLTLTSTIIERSAADSDDRRLALLIRAAVLICGGDTEAGEEEFRAAHALIS